MKRFAFLMALLLTAVTALVFGVALAAAPVVAVFLLAATAIAVAMIALPVWAVIEASRAFHRQVTAGRQRRAPGLVAPPPTPQPPLLRASALTPRVLRSRFGEPLPNWPVVASLRQAAEEVGALEIGCLSAGRAGVPQATTSRLLEEAQEAAGALWRMTDRLAAVRAQRIESPRIHQGLALQKQRLDRLIAATRQARESLAEWTLNGWDNEDLERAEMRLKSLAAAAQEVLNPTEPFDKLETAASAAPLPAGSVA